VTGRRVGERLRHHVVVEDDREAPHALHQRHEAIRLRLAQDVEGEQDVVGDARVDEHLHLTELLTRDAGRARRDLHLPDFGNFVRLDVGSVPDPVPREMGLHAANVLSHDVEIDGDDGRVEVGERGHRVLS
jgi:hypothetical protein